MSRIQFVDNEYYHVFGHAIEGRDLTNNLSDSLRFLDSLREFNTLDPIGSLFEKRYAEKKTKGEKLVDVVCYCLNPNHYHLILRQLVEGGVSKMMHRVGTGFTLYYNEKYLRKGPIFRGRYKAVHLNSNDQLLYASAYVNLNDRVHKLGGSTSKSLVRASWRSYITGENDDVISGQDIILDQFKGSADYKAYAEESLGLMLKAKEDQMILGEIDLN